MLLSSLHIRTKHSLLVSFPLSIIAIFTNKKKCCRVFFGWVGNLVEKEYVFVVLFRYDLFCRFHKIFKKYKTVIMTLVYWCQWVFGLVSSNMIFVRPLWINTITVSATIHVLVWIIHMYLDIRGYLFCFVQRVYYTKKRHFKTGTITDILFYPRMIKSLL